MASATKKNKKPASGSNGAKQQRGGDRKNGRLSPLKAGPYGPQIDVAKDFQQWNAYLASRTIPVTPRKLFPTISTAPLTWGLPANMPANSHVLDLIRITSKLKRKSRSTKDSVLRDWLVPWLAERDSQPASVNDALECLAWAYAAPQMASRLEAGTWRELLAQLLKTVEDAEVELEQTCGWSSMLVSGELPLVLAYQFPELPECRRLAKPAAKFVSQCCEQWLDGSGLPHANHLASIRSLLATFTRSLRLAQETVNAKISKSALSEFNWLVQQALRLTRCDLTSVMTSVDQACPKETVDLFTAALSLGNDKWDAALLQAVLTAHAPKTHQAPRDRDLPDDPSYQSDWSECAVLQTEWSPKTPRLTITHADRQVIGELNVGKEIVFAGNLNPTITINGLDAPITEEWECVCWFSDDDVDMLELRTDLSGGWALERQILLARDDQFLLMADVLLGHEKAELEYSSTLPLLGGCTFKPAKETTDGFLIGNRRLGLVLPLALPEWRTDPRGGTLAESTNGLNLRQSAKACSLYAPLFIDFHSRRMRTIPTWRSLTIAENLNIASRDEAVGYRVQVGVEQWLFYRSIRPVISRTILGQHLSCEFVCGRFLNDGTIESLVEIANDDPRSTE